MIITFDYKNTPHSIYLTEEDANIFEQRFFPLNKFSILALIPEEDNTEDDNINKIIIDINNVDKYLTNKIEECTC